LAIINSISQANLDFDPVINLEEGVKAYAADIKFIHGGTDIS
jgi:hypothetical protein